MARATASRRRTRIQVANEKKILAAALLVFSSRGFAGATLDEIAAEAEMSKPNLLYYFARKEDIYRAVLNRILDDWLEPLRALDPGGDPFKEIEAYVQRKLAMSWERPLESRVFANEILQGAPQIEEVLAGPLKALVEEKALVIQRWIDEGKLAHHDPRHLIFAIWATTQHYSDFAVQIRAVLGADPENANVRQDASHLLKTLFLNGLRPV